MDGTNSRTPSNNPANNENSEFNEVRSQKNNTVSVVKQSAHTKGLKKPSGVLEHGSTQAKALSNRTVFSEKVLKLENINIPQSYLDGCEKYAKYLTHSYPSKTHKILTLGKQCCMINAFLLRNAGQAIEEYIIPRPCSSLKMLVNLSVKKFKRKKKYPSVNEIFDQIIPKTETLNGKTLVISRNLCLIETMALIKPHLEAYLKEKEIPFHFDFAISEVPADYVDTGACETTTKEYYEKMTAMETDPNTSVFKGPPEEINADGSWFSRFLRMNVDYYIPASEGDLKYGAATFEINSDNQYLMDFLGKKALESH